MLCWVSPRWSLFAFPSFHPSPGRPWIWPSLDVVSRLALPIDPPCAAVILLMSLISLLADQERSQETGAGRVLLSITLQAGAEQLQDLEIWTARAEEKPLTWGILWHFGSYTVIAWIKSPLCLRKTVISQIFSTHILGEDFQGIIQKRIHHETFSRSY